MDGHGQSLLRLLQANSSPQGAIFELHRTLHFVACHSKLENAVLEFAEQSLFAAIIAALHRAHGDRFAVDDLVSR